MNFLNFKWSLRKSFPKLNPKYLVNRKIEILKELAQYKSSDANGDVLRGKIEMITELLNGKG